MTTELSEPSFMKSRRGLKAAGLASLIAGLGLGLLTLAAAAGIWLGLWDFRRFLPPGGGQPIRTVGRLGLHRIGHRHCPKRAAI